MSARSDRWKGIFLLLLLGLLVAILGLPFLGTALLGSLLTGSLIAGMAGSAVVLGGVFMLSGFQAASIAAVGGGILALSIRMGKSYVDAVAVAVAASVLAALLTQGASPGFMIFSPEERQLVMSIYTSGGIARSDAVSLLDIMDYLSPGIGSLHIAAGTVAASGLCLGLVRRRGRDVDASIDQMRLGLFPAWLVIGGLALNLMGDPFSYQTVRVARNALLFLLLPYTVIGGIIARDYLRLFPGIALGSVLLLVLAPPVFLGLVALAGLLDTWLDFRKRIENIKERRRNEGPPY
ncbi:hypothetical protein GF402_02970 [Candidatus Fermentibacteria bacterium]|nr:hypothetical protein [Candidatus Fermentibacteria bacterium]